MLYRQSVQRLTRCRLLNPKCDITFLTTLCIASQLFKSRFLKDRLFKNTELKYIKSGLFTLNIYIICLKGMQDRVMGRDSAQFMGSESKTSFFFTLLCCCWTLHWFSSVGNLISIINGYISGSTWSLQDRSWLTWALWLIQEAISAQMNPNKAAVSPPPLDPSSPQPRSAAPPQ